MLKTPTAVKMLKENIEPLLADDVNALARFGCNYE